MASTLLACVYSALEVYLQDKNIGPLEGDLGMAI